MKTPLQQIEDRLNCKVVWRWEDIHDDCRKLLELATVLEQKLVWAIGTDKGRKSYQRAIKKVFENENRS